MKIAFVCPRCENVVIAEYSESKLELIEPCECVEEDLEGWFEYIYKNWDNVENLVIDYEALLEHIKEELKYYTREEKEELRELI